VTADLALAPLRGRNPLGLFAALGALDVATRTLPDREVTLRWTEGIEPHAVLRGPDSLDHLVALCHDDVARWESSPILAWGPGGAPLDDLKPSPEELRQWTVAVLEHALQTGQRADADLFGALVAEGAMAGKGDSKPTAFHFTAGQQRFLTMVRELRAGLTAQHLDEALRGPWTYASPLPVLGWDARGERIYALRGPNPAKEKKLGVPGADWLAFLGLRFFPVAARTGHLLTTGCAGAWKKETFTWPLWRVNLPSAVCMSLLADGGLTELGRSERRQLGVHELLRAPIRRLDPGGLGSFGAPSPVQVPAPGSARSEPT
jgi:hypothetical protein